MKNDHQLLLLEQVLMKATKQAAIACYDKIGCGDNKLCDHLAVEAIRDSLNTFHAGLSFVVKIGEGERDEAPMLFIGEEVGSKEKNAECFDLALDPLEGTNLCAKGHAGSIAIIAASTKGSLLHAPDVYMDKIVVGGKADGIDLDNKLEDNLRALAKAKGKDLSELRIIVLERSRHETIINTARALGVKVYLIDDGDIAASITVLTPDSEFDMYIGSGGAPEGILTAGIVNTVGGFMQGRLLFGDDERQKERARKMGITDLNKKYTAKEMAKAPVICTITGVTDSPTIGGIKKTSRGFSSHTKIFNGFAENGEVVKNVIC